MDDILYTICSCNSLPVGAAELLAGIYHAITQLDQLKKRVVFL